MCTVLWKLIEKKFRQIGEFVEGKENLDIVVHRTFDCGMEAIQVDEEDDEEEDSGDESSEGGGSENNKFKRQKTSSFGELANEDSIQHDIEELAREEEAMLNIGLEDDDDNADTAADNSSNDGAATKALSASSSSASRNESTTKTSSKAGQGESAAAICLLDDSDDEDENADNRDGKTGGAILEKDEPASNRITVSDSIAEFTRQGGDPRCRRFGSQARFKNLRIYKIHFTGPSFGLWLVPYQGRIVVNFAVKIKENSPEQNGTPFAGDIVVSVNGAHVPHNATLDHVTNFMRQQVALGRTPVELQFAHDPDFSAWFRDSIIPLLVPVVSSNENAVASMNSAGTTPPPVNGVATAPAPVAAAAGSARPQPSSTAGSSGGDEVIELLDD